MKTRNGFVSNSSSSSFIISKTGSFKSTIEVAHHMIVHRRWADDPILLRNLLHFTRDGTVDVNTNLCFRSCNYDTYIIDKGDKIIVNTCNNTDWKFPADVKGDPNEECYEESHDKKMLMLSSGIVGERIGDKITVELQKDIDSPTVDIAWCKDCGMEVWIVDSNKIMCPVCETVSCFRSKSNNKWKKS